jgi:hypothetical protein
MWMIKLAGPLAETGCRRNGSEVHRELGRSCLGPTCRAELEDINHMATQHAQPTLHTRPLRMPVHKRHTQYPLFQADAPYVSFQKG